MQSEAKAIAQKYAAQTPSPSCRELMRHARAANAHSASGMSDVMGEIRVMFWLEAGRARACKNARVYVNTPTIFIRSIYLVVYIILYTHATHVWEGIQQHTTDDDDVDNSLVLCRCCDDRYNLCRLLLRCRTHSQSICNISIVHFDTIMIPSNY